MRFLIAAMTAAAFLVSTDAALADKRVAFVVGNGAYKNVAPLPNPAVDAKSMAKVLRNFGFDVVEGTNLTRDQMTEKLLDFGKKAEGADVAVFFYAGHGIAVNGTNYLLPVDADLKSEMDVKLGAAINVDLTLEQTMSDAKVKLVFLDACRDNPFAAKIRSAKATRSVAVGSGLAEMKSGEGTLIAFATGPGQTALDGEAGTNSPFTRALMANLPAPGIDPATFTEEADQVSEGQIGLDKGQRRDVQRRLNGLGFDTKINGRFDEATRGVIKRWQAARNYPASGYLNQLQHKALLSEIVSARVASSDNSDDESVHHSRRSGGGGRHYRGGGGGPGGPG